MDKICVYGGKGFVGGKFCNTFLESVVIKERLDFEPETPRILDFISTVDNYNLQRDLPFEDVESNLLTLLVILEKARAKYGNHFELNFISSWFVYGKITDFPAKEDSACNPTGFYSITKRCAEQLLISYCETYNIKWRILRLGNVLGVGDKKASYKKNALQHMVRELVQGKSIHLYKDDCLRDFIDVRDAAQAIKIILDKGSTNQIYNVGNGVGVSIWESVNYVQSKFPDSPIELVDTPQFHKLVQVRDMYLDITKLSKLGYKQMYSITDTLDWLIDYYRE